MGGSHSREIISAEHCRAFAGEFRSRSKTPGVSKDSAFIMNNIARSLMGLATQLDLLAIKTREEGKPPHAANSSREEV